MGWWFGRKSAPPAVRPFAPAWLSTPEVEGFARFLTFELIADEVPPTVSDILADASGGSLDSSDPAALVGYAAHGSSVAASVAPIVDRLGLTLVDDGEALRSPAQEPALALSSDELGAGCEGRPAPRLSLTQQAASNLPVSLTLNYYDPERDYQSGQARAAQADGRGRDDSVEMPAVLTAEAARAVVESELARRWASRDRLTLRLPPRRLDLRPGRLVELDALPGRWSVERCTIEGFVVVAELTRLWSGGAELQAEAGRIAQPLDEAVEPTSLAVFDVPQIDAEASSGPTLHLAASSPASRWRSVPVEMHSAGRLSWKRTAATKAVLGRALSILPPAAPHLLDLAGEVTVELVDPAQWLQSCTDIDLAAGANMAVLGREILQFGRVEPAGSGRFILSRLVRGSRGTEWAMAAHGLGDDFALLDPAALQTIVLDPALRGSAVEFRPLGIADSEAIPVSAIASGDGLRPPSPVHLRSRPTPEGGLEIDWVRRSRLGWMWVDEVDAPLGEEQELYRVAITGVERTVIVECDEPHADVDAATVSSVGAGQIDISVQQLGDFGASRPATLSIS